MRDCGKYSNVRVFGSVVTVLTNRVSIADRKCFVVVASLLFALVVCFASTQGSALASDEKVTQNRAGPDVKSIAQIKVDDENRPLGYPTELSYDPVYGETYLVYGVPSRVVVYGPDFFPRISIGPGRGLLTPQGLAVTDNGEVYVCQPRTDINPFPRITILNAAFFVDREILLDEIPEAAGFIPRRLAVNADGLLYVIGDNTRGVLVLDKDGEFLRWLQPLGMVNAGTLAQDEKRRSAGQKRSTEEEQALDKEMAEDYPEEDRSYDNIPEEFRPRSSSEKNVENWSQKVEAPVVVNFLSIAESGKLYLISSETSQVYVYSPDETFLFSFGTKGGSPGQMSQPRALVVDEEQQLVYVADYMRHTILVYNLDGEYLFELGGRGAAPGWYNFPTAMTMNKDRQFIVADQFNGRVQVLELGYQEWLKKYDVNSFSDGIIEDVEHASEEEPVQNVNILTGGGENAQYPMSQEESFQEQPEAVFEVNIQKEDMLISPDVEEGQKKGQEELQENDVFEVLIPEEKVPNYPNADGK